MADKAVKRDGFETVEEAGWSAAKGAATGGLLVVGTAGLVGAALFAIIPALVTATLLTGGLATAGWVATGIAALAGGAAGAAGAASGASIVAGIGGLFGLMKGASKASRENALYASKSNEKLMGKEADMVEAHNQGMKMGYQTAIQQMQPQVEQYGKQAYEAGKQEVLTELQQHAHAEHKPAHHEHKHAQHEEKPKASFVAAVAADREKAVAAGAAVGV